MARNDNSVNIKNAGDRYHHGDLRAALVAEGLKQLKRAPAGALSLREVARNVGVSATAVYHHFPDKAALLGALSLEGDQRLANAFEKAMAKAEPGLDAFNAMGRAYVRFALANPYLFRLMMSAEAGVVEHAQSRGRGMLARGIAELSGANTSKALQDVRQLRAWSMVHGLALLMLDGLVPADDSLIERVVDADVL